ncbi:MAG: porin [Desulfobacteraceae bacterium]|jgi:phosphate-selective porin
MVKKCFIILTCLLLFPAAASADKTDKLIELLIKKNIVTAEEARVIVSELENADEGKPDDKLTAKTEKTSAGRNENIEVKYKKGVVINTADNNYSLRLNARFHGIFSYSNPDNSESESTFRMRRARILASGNVFAPWLKYSTQITLEGSNAAMRDAYIEAAYNKQIIPRIGQYKVPFDREFLDGGFNLQLIERSIASSEFSLQRDIGLQISGKKILDSFDYSVGFFNGSGANQNNVDNDYMYVGRLVWSPFASYPYSESAVDNPSSPVFSLAVAGAYIPGLEPGERATLAGKLGNTSIVPVESDVTQWTADLAYKCGGFSLMSGYHYRNIDPKDITSFGEQDAWGFYIQSGFFLIPKHFEIAGRYAYIDPDNPEKISDNEKSELTMGLNYYLNGHNVKTGINYSLFSTDKQSGDEDEHVITTSVIVQF